MSKEVVNPFSAAKRQPSVAAKTPPSNIFVPTEDNVREAIVNYCEGATLESQGKSMKDASRPAITQFALPRFAEQWLTYGKRPANPKVASSDDAGGRFIGVIFKDQSIKLNQETYVNLANLIGIAAAEEHTVRRDDFLINPEVLEDKVDVNLNGQVQKMRVMDAIAQSLQETFSPSPEILKCLFQVISRFETKKGLIDLGPSLVAPNKTPTSVARLVQFIETACPSPSLKPGASGTE